jgi:hypothetical protein
MKPNQQLDLFNQEFDYYDYLVTTVRKPHHKGVLKNINQRIKCLQDFIKSETENSLDEKIIKKANMLLKKYEALKERYYSIYPKNNK